MRKTRQKNKKGIRLRRALLFAAVLAVLGSLTFVWWTLAADAPVVHVVFSDGAYRGSIKEDYRDTNLFEDVSLEAEFTEAGCLIIPGTDFQTTTDGKITASDADTVDCETFYFDEEVEGEARWAYSFTGWQVKGSTQRIPAQTVFQPGDTVTPDVLQELAEAGFYTPNGDGSYTVELEAVWGKCYFIRNPYDKMLYSKDATYGWSPDLDASLQYAQAKGLNPNGAYSTDDNVGNDPSAPKSTIDGLFADLRTEIYDNKTQSAEDAYAIVVMLVGDLDYYKDTDKATSHYGFKSNANTNRAFISTTYKSRQTDADPATGYLYNYKPQKYSNTTRSNMRFDNVNFVLYRDLYTVNNPEVATSQGSASTEFMLTRVNASTFHYFESTARFNRAKPSGRSWAISTFRPADYNVVVLNGGSFGTWHTSYSGTIAQVNGKNKLLKWYFGRNAEITSAITCGTTSNYDYTVHNLYVDIQLNITGGRIATVYGGSAGSNSICIGTREINVYGNDQNTRGQRDPQITSLYGGSDRARFFGDIYVNLHHTKLVTNLYGGGNYFSATTYGNITVHLDQSTVKQNLFGGGKNGNTEIVPAQYVQYTAANSVVTGSTLKDTKVNLKVPAEVGSGGKVTIEITNGSVVEGNVFGSGMGSSQTMSVTEKASEEKTPTNWYDVNYYPAGWADPLTTYPSYQRDTGYFLIGAERRISWTEYSPESINFYSDNTLAYLSLATVQDVEINIIDSTVGTEGNLSAGNVYGGGSIAKVLGDTVIKVVNSTVYGNVFGGGDGSTMPETVTLYRPLTGLASYKSPTYTVTEWDQDSAMPSKVSIKSRSHSYAQSAYKYETPFTWSGESYLLTDAYNGIDFENHLIYSPNTEGLGSVSGNTTVTVEGSLTDIRGAVYGGGNMGAVGGSTTVTVKNGTVNEIYAGCNRANVQGDAVLDIQNGTVTSAYGGNNQSGSIHGQIRLSMENGSVASLYGGGNLASYTGTVTLVATGGEVGTLFGGGKQADVNATVVDLLGTVSVQNAYGGGDMGATKTNCRVTVGENASVVTLYGGANAADIDGDVTLTVQSGTVSGELFGANNQSGMISGEVQVQVGSGSVEVLYGGGNHADYSGKTVVTLTGGTYGTLYGGGKVARVGATELSLGAISVEGSVYGGGYQGDVLTDAVVELRASKISGSLYGGGYNGNVQNTTAITLASCTVGGSIYGGGYRGNVTGSASVEVLALVLDGNLYGGGYAGTVGGTDIRVDDSEFGAGSILIYGSLFGGGEGSTATVLGSTNVDVYMVLDFTAREVSSDTDHDTPSGASTTENEITVDEYSKILGNVFGGGDLGQVGDGRIIQSSNTAQVSHEGSASVTIRNGYIGKSVFGGGSGVPKDGQVYNVKMGTVFGSTRTNIYGGYIEGSVYGGGTQSRVYGADEHALVACVSIDQTQPNSLQKILIGGSVFSGGDRGTGATQNASVPTTVGNVEVNITGAAGNVASDIYFLRGGIYGDGNLCLVRGLRTISIKDYHTDQQNTLKTFYSLQRADTVKLDNSRVVLLGAIDLVEEGDSTVYSINRVGRLYMQNGSTVKLDQIVKYLGELESSVDPTRVFVDRGNNGSNNYDDLGGSAERTDALTEKEILDYQELANEKNTVCVANGLYLRLESEQTNSLGTVKGLFSLSLLRAKVGEGGGFVYASIPLSTGAFICETFMDGTKHYNAVETPMLDAFESGIYYVEDGNGAFVRAVGSFDANTAYYTKNYMKVIGDVGGYMGGSFTYYYWYINGSTIQYSMGLTGYIGSMETRYGESISIPPHARELHYVLNTVEGNDTFQNAIKGVDPTYQLLKNVTFDGEGNPILIDQQIAIEARLGDISLGFVWYDEAQDTWYLCQPTKDFEGYNEQKHLISDNVLLSSPITVNALNSNIELVLYKSTEVNAELSGMSLELVIDLYFDNGEGVPGNVFNEGANKLKFLLKFAIERLMPEQTLFYQPGESYGVATTVGISITGQSSFTAQYKTRYIPTAFPATGGMGMRWVLSAKSYYYYLDSVGNYLTVDGNGECVNLSGHLSFDDSLDVSSLTFNSYPERTVLKRDDGSYFYKADDSNGVTQLYEFVLKQQVETPVLPVGTKITMIDISPGINPTFYYYFCASPTESVDVMDFALMGSTQSIRNGATRPAFMDLYADPLGKQASSRVTEEVLFIVDFSNADWDTENQLNCAIEFKHFYGNSTSGVDIMDYVSVIKEPDSDEIRGYIRECSRPTPYSVHPSTNGLENFEVEFEIEGDAAHPEYYDLDTMQLNINIQESMEQVNTMLSEESYIIRLSLLNNGVEKLLPTGIRVEADGRYFYPSAGNKYILIRLESGGTHEIYIESYLTSMREAFGESADGTVQLSFALYSAQYDETSGALSVGGVAQANTVCLDTYHLYDNPEFSLAVSSDIEDRFLKPGEIFHFQITTKVSGNVISHAHPTVSLSRWSAEAGVYEEVEIGSVFLSNTAMQSDGAYAWRTFARSAKGTYRLQFNYGDRVEYLTFVLE